MNCFSGCHNRRAGGKRLYRVLLRSLAFAFLVAPVMACGGPSSDTDTAVTTRAYDLLYRVTPDPSQASVTVELELQQATSLLREVRFQVRGDRFTDFEGDGDIHSADTLVRWTPPAQGGTLRWQAQVPHRRNGDGYDAWLGEDWGLFRAEDIIPGAATRTARGAYSRTRLVFDLPAGWSVVTQYAEEADVFRVRRGERRFKQPKGWIVMGGLGVRRDQIAGVDVVIAGPVDNGVRRLDMLALLNWTLPELARIRARYAAADHDLQCARAHVARRSVRTGVTVHARRSPPAQRERHEYAAPRDHARRARLRH